jgi:hypothetical protein
MGEVNVASEKIVFRVGELYSNAEIQDALEVGNAGGVRVKLGDDKSVRRVVVTTTKAKSRIQSENPYHDRIEGDILTYTGAGK